MRRDGVDLKWLFRTHTRLFPQFLRDHDIAVESDGAFTYVQVDGTPYVWPAGANVDPLKHLLAELLTSDHPHEYDYGRTRITPTDVVLDIGCCDGGFAAKAAELGATVIAVEPSRIMAGVIHRLFELRGLAAPEIQQCLLGSKAGAAFFQDNVQDPARSQITEMEQPGSYPIRVTTLDSLVPTLTRPPTYIKCDAEGADLDILRGGREYLREHHPKVAVTAYHNTDDGEQITSLLREVGYKNVDAKGVMYVGGELRTVMIHAA